MAGAFWSTTQPSAGTLLDEGQPLSQGLICCILANQGAGQPQDLRNRARVAREPTSWIAGRFGRAAVTSMLADSTGDLQPTAGGWTAATLVRIVALPGSGEYPNIFGRSTYASESVNSGWSLQMRPPEDGFSIAFISNNNNGFGSYFIGSTTPAAVGDWLIVGTSDGVTRRLYINGVLENSAATNPTPLAGIGDLFVGDPSNARVYPYCSWVWKRCLSPVEVSSLKAAPYQMFAPPVWRRYFSSTSITSAIRDVAARFKLRVQGYRDAAVRLRVRSAATYADIGARVRLASPSSYRDTAVRLRVQSAATYRDVVERFRLRVTTLRDLGVRFRLASVSTRDTGLRFRMAALAFKDAGVRFVLQALGQTAEPLSDAINEGWTDQGGGTTNLYTTLDELTANDADYIQSPSNPSGQRYRSALDTVTDPGVSTGHVVRYRIGKDNANQSLNITVRLLEGATTIATWTETDIPQAFTTVSRTLTSPEAAAISNYSALALEFEASA